MRSKLLILGVLGSASPAAAEDPPTPPTPAATTVVAGERVTMPAKRGMIHALVGVNLSKENAGDPISFSPDIFYGVNDKLTIGLVHSFTAATGIMGIPGTSICVGDNCTDPYNGLGLDVRYTVKTGSLGVAANGGFYVDEFDPFQMQLKLGAIIHWRSNPKSKLAVDFTPAVFVGVTERDGDLMAAAGTDDGNKETLVLPATLWYSVTPKIALAGQVAVVMPVEDAGDFFQIPVSIGMNYQVDKRISIDAAFTLPIVAGGKAFEEVAGVDARTFTIGGGYAF